MISFNGVTDSSISLALAQITWQIRYNVLTGECPNNQMFREAIAKNSCESEGRFSIKSAPIAGSQVTTINWYIDEDRVRFSIESITAPQ